jgi:hypothetical protein
MLGYCNELGVALEVEVNSSRSTLLQNDTVFGGKPIRQAQAVNDTRGHMPNSWRTAFSKAHSIRLSRRTITPL